MNKRKDLPPSIIFSSEYIDKSPAINTLVQSSDKKAQTDSGIYSGYLILAS